jgi:hypothetical protein
MGETVKILRKNLEVTDYQTLRIYADDRIASVAPCRSGEERIDIWWIEADTLSSTRDRGIYIVGTGHRMPDVLSGGVFLGTCVMSSGLVWHVFEGPVKR